MLLIEALVTGPLEKISGRSFLELLGPELWSPDLAHLHPHEIHHARDHGLVHRVEVVLERSDHGDVQEGSDELRHEDGRAGELGDVIERVGHPDRLEGMHGVDDHHPDSSYGHRRARHPCDREPA
ncbi:hypothetical protein ES703_72826 [subsurface metagenome]